MIVAKIFIAGVVFLFLTIAVNAAVIALKLTSWYDFIGIINIVGIAKALSKVSMISLIWLFIGYPFFLGFLVYILRGILR